MPNLCSSNCSFIKSHIFSFGICYTYSCSMVYPIVRGDNPRVDYLPYRRTIHGIAIYTTSSVKTMLSGEPGLVDRVLALHAGSRGFHSHRGHMSEQFFRSNRPGYPHPVSSELENSGIRVAVGDCSVTERRRWRPPYQTGKTVHVHANTTNTTRTDARRRVCAAMVPYR